MVDKERNTDMKFLYDYLAIFESFRIAAGKVPFKNVTNRLPLVDFVFQIADPFPLSCSLSSE